ncbi:MAG: replicative DNA helicase, partial [Candidatus Dadabacteria bacterium]|nr:replicative DNA helicase [Candidatus Dadabacteria bacterium]NIQ15230.1 replicative DNA helicase [Candidatus Dadabacteria bacterium]
MGSILIENSSLNQVLEILTPEDFYKDSHSKIFNCMIDLDKENSPIDVLTLYEYMNNKGKLLEEIGGSAYLTYLTEIVPTAYNVSHYAKIVKDKSILRKIVLTATDIAHHGYEQSLNVDDYLDRAEHAILDIAQNKVKPSFYHTRDLAKDALELIEQLHDRKELITG